MEKQVSTKRSVNYAFKIVGYLGHDNKLFDRTCPACRKGMYSSREYSRCPKCGGVLGYLTNADGKAIAISEGTVYPAFGPKQEKSDAMAIAKRKNGMLIKYRFKMFSFIDEHGVLIPPAEHGRCRSGAKVEIMIMRHQLIPSWFMGKDENNPNSETKVPWVELMMPIFTNAPYNDYVKVLTEQEYASKTISHNVYPDGSPVPIEVPTAQPTVVPEATPITGIDADIAALEKRIAAIKAAQAPAVQAPVPQPVAPQVLEPQPEPFDTDSVPWEEQRAMSVADGNVDPFTYA
jgi:hypothetical protein